MMKKIFIMALAALTMLLSCTKQETGTKLSKVILTPSELSLEAGTSKSIEMSVEPSGAVYTTISWSSSDNNVATVTRKGSVTAVGAGTAVITCKVDDVEAKCTVTVTAVEVPVTGVSLDKESLSVFIDASEELKATVEPDNATNKKVTWESSNPNVATVADGVVTGVSHGACKVIVTTEDGSYTDTCSVRVTTPASISYVELDGVWSKNTYPVFSPDCKTAYIITLTTRKLIAIDLELGMIKWTYDLTNATTPWAGNPGDFCVNPANGDIICCNQCEVFAIKSNGKEKRWSIVAEEATPSDNSQAFLGCGPAMSNDNSVIFAPFKSGLYALSASDGSVISQISPLVTGHCQFAVYGDDNIVFHTHGEKTVKFITFKNNTLEVANSIASDLGDLADITCPVVSSDQKKAWFFGKGMSVCVNLETQTISSVDNWTSVTEEGYPGHGLGYRWSGVLTEQGKLAYGTQYNGNTVAMIVLDASQDLGKENGLAPYKYASPKDDSKNNTLNHQGVAADSDGNFYLYMNDYMKMDNTSVANYYLYKITYDGLAYHKEALAKTEGAKNGDFQGAFAFGGNYLVAVHGNPGKVLICAVGEERAHSWGNGGDAQGTKNANNIK